MSKEIAYIYGIEGSNLAITQFYGGWDKGPCLQLTPSYKTEYVSLDRHHVGLLVIELQRWLLDQDGKPPV